MKKILIKNGYVLDPANKIMDKYDILISGNKIEKVSRYIENEEATIIDAKGKFVTPGFIDLQVNPGNTIESICDMLPYCGVTTPLIMPCNVRGKTFLDYYGGLEQALEDSEGQRVNVANAISIEPPDTSAHETYIQFSVRMDEIQKRIEQLIDLGVTALGEVVLPIGGTAHIHSNMGEEFLDKLLDYTDELDIPILLHTGLGLDGIISAIKIAKGRQLHICHVGSTTAQDNIHSVLDIIHKNPNITVDTHLSEVAGSNSKKSKLVVEYFGKGEVVSIDSETLEATVVEDLEKAKAPFYYNKTNLFENNVTCAMSEFVHAIESDDLGDGIRSKIMIKNFFKLVNAVSIEGSKIKLMYKLIKKMTINPARILKIENRGSLGEGKYADIILIDLEKEKINTVLVNGEIVLLDDNLTNSRPGVRVKYKEK